jgi:hypothetical protein
MTTLPMERCPGCRCVLEFPIQIPFRHPSALWRAAVADSFPVCLDCSLRMEGDFRDHCETTAAEWWVMNQEIYLLNHPVCDDGGKPILYMLVAEPPVPQNE